jgi:SAM-dependent methyltransferase
MLFINFHMSEHKPFTKTASLYDAIYTKKRYTREARIIGQLVHHYNIQGKQLLDLGCGTGKHCIEFSRLGYIPTGIDVSLPMITIAKRNMKSAGLSFPLVRSDISHYRPKKTFGVVVSLFHVLSYQTTNDSVVKFFRAASRFVAPGGLFIFDCWYGPGVFLLTPKDRTRRFMFQHNPIIRMKRNEWDIENNVVHVHHKIYTNGPTNDPVQETHSMRYFFLPELRGFLLEAGFQLREWGTLNFPMIPIREPSWELCVVAQRNAQ